jgi:MFS family permease
VLEKYRTLGTIICAPVVPQILSEFHSQNTVYTTLLVSIWELGEVVSPLIVAPLSELYGRFWLYQICNGLYIVFSVGCALSRNIHMLVAFRFLCGLSTVSLTLNPSVVGDLFEVQHRGSAMALVGLMPMLGPVSFSPLLSFSLESFSQSYHSHHHNNTSIFTSAKCHRHHPDMRIDHRENNFSQLYPSSW